MQTDNFSNVDKTKIFSEISGNFKTEAKQINFIKYVFSLFSAAAAELWFRLLLTADWLIALNNKPGKIQTTNYWNSWRHHYHIGKRRECSDYDKISLEIHRTRNWTRINTRWLWISRLQGRGRKKENNLLKSWTKSRLERSTGYQKSNKWQDRDLIT